MEDDMVKGIPVAEFGHWDYYNGLPMKQYFESAWQTHFRFWGEDEDLFKVPVAAQAPTQPAYYQVRSQVKKGGDGRERQGRREEKQRKLSKGSEVSSRRRTSGRRHKVPKAVDEDLYKIPPELVCRRPQKKRLLGNFLSGCLGLSCIP